MEVDINDPNLQLTSSFVSAIRKLDSVLQTSPTIECDLKGKCAGRTLKKKSFRVHDKNECFEKCRKKSDCKWISYNVIVKTCYIYHGEKGIGCEEDGRDYYISSQRECFIECPQEKGQCKVYFI